MGIKSENVSSLSGMNFALLLGSLSLVEPVDLDVANFGTEQQREFFR